MARELLSLQEDKKEGEEESCFTRKFIFRRSLTSSSALATELCQFLELDRIAMDRRRVKGLEWHVVIFLGSGDRSLRQDWFMKPVFRLSKFVAS